jgi:lysophospholipase L1-like esterase
MSEEMILKTNDRVVFLGDSITQQQLYTNYAEAYLACRFPQLRLSFFNAGWSGTGLAQAIDRLERDVLSLKPTVVTVCFGMNDGAYQTSSPALVKTFRNNLEKLTRLLRDNNIRPVLLTPGFVDENVPSFVDGKYAPSLKAVNFNNGTLRDFSDTLLEFASSENLAAFDLHKLMNQTDYKIKKQNQDLVLTFDGVHPNEKGHLVMAYGLLKAFKVPPLDLKLNLEIDAPIESLADSNIISRKENLAGALELEIKIKNLPFWVPPAARAVLPYIDFQKEYNSLNLLVNGSKTAKVLVKGENFNAGVKTRAQLSKGLDIFQYWTHPIHEFSKEILDFTALKDRVYYTFWRKSGFDDPDKSKDYNFRKHWEGVTLSPELEYARQALINRAPDKLKITFNKIEGAFESVGEECFVTRWHLSDVFNAPFEKEYFKINANFNKNISVFLKEWRKEILDSVAYGNNVGEILEFDGPAFVYACAVLESPLDQKSILKLGTAEGFACWFNGRKLDQKFDLERGVTVDHNTYEVKFKTGINTVLFKVIRRQSNCGLCLRFNGLKQELKAKWI